MPESQRDERLVRKFVQSFVKRGRTFHYYRRGSFKIRLPDDAGSAEFASAWAAAHAKYEALNGEAPAATGTAKPGSVRALIAAYRSSPEFRALAAKSQRDYGRMLAELDLIEAVPAREIGRHHIVKLRNEVARRGARTGDLFVAIVGALFRCGMDLGYGITVNPAHDIRRLNEPRSYQPWSAAHRQAFEASSPTPHLLTGYMIGLWTALRLGNVLRLSRAQFDGEGFDVRHLKTETDGWIPVHQRLRAHLDTLPATSLLYVVDAKGRSIPERRFSREFREHLDSVGLAHLHFHGLRATRAVALAESGASGKEIASVTGHRTGAMVELYTRRANQKHLARSAMRRVKDE